MFRWFIYNLILRNPTTSFCLLAMIIVAVFSIMIGWPAYVFLGICVLGLIIYGCISSKVKLLSIKNYNNFELNEIERKNRWIMGLLSVFVFSGIVVSLHLTISCIEYAANTSSIIGTMALFHFILIGIPYILMNMVKRKSSFWYGLMFPILLAAIIQFLVFYMFAESSREITRYTSSGFERLHGNWLVVFPLLFIPIFMFLDSLGKAFGFRVDDDTYNMGFDKEKHELSIDMDKRRSLIGMAVSIFWSVLSLIYCYYYVKLTLQ